MNLKAKGCEYDNSIECNSGSGISLKVYALLVLCAWPFFPIGLTAQEFTRAEILAGLDVISYSNGVAVADYDQDGDLDIFFVGFKNFDPKDSTHNRLLMNSGNGTFVDVTLESGFSLQPTNGENLGAAWGDYDNDGFPDLFLTNFGPVQLYRNQGNGRFEDVTEQAGIDACDDCFSSSALWWDYDLDGDLDLYVSILFGENTMYENHGDGTFEDVTTQTGLGNFGMTWASVALDAGQDGILDLYVVNDFGDNIFYEGNAEKYFEPATEAYGLEDQGHGMGVAIGDYNNDGFFDIYVTNIAAYFLNPLFTNTGQSGFVDLSTEMGVADTGWGWGTQFLDYDHDGDEDLYVVNGVISEFKADGIVQEERKNFLFKNLRVEGTESFIDWSMESNTNGEAKALGMETFDYDEDGDLDIVVANIEEPPYLYRNETIKKGLPETSNWIKIWLEGTVSNRDALGSRVKLTIGDESYHRYHHGAGFLGQSLKPVHFGLGQATVIDEIQVIWPRGDVESVFNVKANKTLHLKEGNLVVTGVGGPLESTPLQVISYPNPFETSVNLRIDLPKPGKLDLRIFSVVGIELFRSSTTASQPGSLEISWEGLDRNGLDLSPGVYLYQVIFEDHRIIGKLFKSSN